jgi:tetratricopeptide (TPR) repeat protein
VFWVPAISRESFELAYREIGIRLRIPGITDDNANVQQLVKEALDNMRDWLMIVDNADEPDVLMNCSDSDPDSPRLLDYIPHNNRGKVVFTTRSRKAAGDLTQANMLELQDLGKVEARDLLTRRIMKQTLLTNGRAIDELLEILTYLPLAIVQAAAFINNNDISIAAYTLLVRNAETEIEIFGEKFEDPSRYREMDSTIAKTWYISFDQIRKQDKLAAEYLSFIACIDRINIPQSLLPPGDSPLQHTKAIGTLKGYTFITERQQSLPGLEGEVFFDMHRLVHMMLAQWLDGHDERKAWITKAANRLEEVVPYGGHEKKDSWTTYLPHTVHMSRSNSKLDERTRASLLNRIGRCQITLGQYSAAEAMIRRALVLREGARGQEDQSTLASMNDLAVTLEEQGKYAEAESMHRQTLATRQKVLGVDHPSTLTTMNNLAGVLDNQGKYAEAESMHRQTLATREKVLGVDHPSTLTTMNNLAGVLGKQGKYTEAESMHRQTLATSEKVLGVDHPSTLTTMNNLALVLGKQGKYTEAESMHRQTLATSEKVLGVDHPATLTTMNNLAGVLDNQGKYAEAESMHRQTLATREKVLGVDHPDTLTTMNNLALVLDHQGKYAEAESMHRQALAMCEKVLGVDHPSTLTTMNNLAGVLDHQGKYAEAESMHRQTLATSEKVLGVDHPDTLTTMNNLALVLDNQGKYAEAESMHRQTLATRQKVLGVDHPNTLKTMNNLAGVLDSQGKYTEAESIYRQTLAVCEKVLSVDHPDTLTSVYCLAHLLASQLRYAEADLLYKRVLAGRKEVLGDDHPSTRRCLQHYSEMLMSCKEHHDKGVRGGNCSTPEPRRQSRLSRGLAKIGIRRSRLEVRRE